MREQKQLAPIAVSEGGAINRVTFSTDSRLAFLYYGKEGSLQVIVYDVQQQKSLPPIQLPSGIKFHDPILFIPVDQKSTQSVTTTLEEKESKYLVDQERPLLQTDTTPDVNIVLYGEGGCFIWRSCSGQIIPIIVDNIITSAEIFQPTNGVLQLVTAGTDCVCRLWDITDLDKPLLEFCTRGMTFYGQGVNLDSTIGLSDENQSFLLRKGAGKIANQETRSTLSITELPDDDKYEEKSVFKPSTTKMSLALSASSSNSFSEPSTTTLTTSPPEGKINIASHVQRKKSSSISLVPQAPNIGLFTPVPVRDEKARMLLEEVRTTLVKAYPLSTAEQADLRKMYLSQLEEYQARIDTLVQSDKVSLTQLLTTLQKVVQQQQSTLSTTMQF